MVPRRLGLLLTCLIVVLAGPAPARVYYVGPEHQYKRPSEVTGLVAPGDLVEIEPGDYYDCAVWRTDRLTVVGRGGGPVMTDTQCADKASFVINGDDVVLRNITFTRIRVPDRNGAGIRHQGHDLTVENCRFINNEIGILSSAAADARITIRDSRFDRNGMCSGGRCLPSLLVPGVTVLRIEHSVFTGSRGGVLIRSSAVRTVLMKNQIEDGPTGTAERLVVAGGDLIADGNMFERGPGGQNVPAVTVRGLWRTPEIVLRGNMLTNHSEQPALLLENLSSADPVLDGNRMADGDSPVSNVGLLAARVRDVAHRGLNATAPLQAGLRHLEQKLMPQ